MAKPKTSPKVDQDKAPTAPAAPAPGDSTAAEGPADPLVTLGLAVGLPGAFASPPAELGALPAAHTEPAIPPDIDAELNPRERRIVWRMVNGATYAQACRDTARAQDGKPSSQTRTDDIPPAVQAAVSACLRQIAAKAGLSREWLIAQTVALYARAAQAEPVLDRKGRPTGTYRFDGATASKCLDMLAQWEGTLYPRKTTSPLAGELAALLQAVAGRRATVPGVDRERLIGSSSAAPQQQEKSLTDQGPDSADSSVMREQSRASH